ncbi:MAG: histidine kinase [Cyclobacteriaceae bacterium]
MAGYYAQSNNKSPLGDLGALGAGALGAVAFFSSLPAVLFYTYLHYSETGVFPSLQKNISGFLTSILIGIILGLALYTFNKLLDRWISWGNYFSSRFLAGYCSNVIISLLIVVPLATVVIKFLPFATFWRSLSLKDPDLMWKIIILLLVFLFIYNIIYALLYAYQHYAIAQLEHLQSERKQLELQFEALKGQISPHYLFNSLNTISSLLFKDLQSAEQFIRRLAQTYQYILATQNKKYVLLKEELDFVQSYYYLLRIRFQQQLNVEINVPLNIMNTRIPPLTLQMLVENAVKHNTLSGEKKLFIFITAQDNTYVKVVNTKTEEQTGMDSFKVGLENIRKRYRYFTDKQIVVKSDEKFMVSLPVIHAREDSAERKYSA